MSKKQENQNFLNNFTDYSGVPIILDWTDKMWNYHLNKHPEIKDRVFASKLINDAVSSPSLVISGTKPGNNEMLRCYYKEHKRNKNELYYTKVVIGCRSKPFYVKTVFMQWALCDLAVQEKKYSFKELFRAPDTYFIG